MGIGDYFLDQPVASLSIAVCQPVIQSAAFRVFDFVVKVAFFLMAERLTVGDQELQVTRVRAIDGRIVDLIDNSVAQRKPSMAASMIGGPDPLLAAGRPLWTKPW